MILYSTETDLIYDTAIHKVIPNDAVEISLTEKHEHMGNVTYEGKRRVKHIYPFEFEDIPPPAESEIARSEYNWAKSEIESITEQLEKHADNSSRAIATEQEWRDYREALREHAAVDDDGVYYLRTERPVRPS